MSIEKLPQLIPAGEAFLFVTSLPPAQVTEPLILSRVRAAQLRTGDTVVVQCKSHHGDELLGEAEFRVIARRDSIRTRDLDGYQTMQDTALDYEIAQVGDWWDPRASGRGATVDDPRPKRGAGKKAAQRTGAEEPWASLTASDANAA